MTRAAAERGLRAGRPPARRPLRAARALESNAVVLPDGTDADVVGLASDPLEACVQVFHVRDGRIRGERGCHRKERVDDADEAAARAQDPARPDVAPEPRWPDVPR